MKNYITLLFLVYAKFLQAQEVKLLLQNNKIGFETYDSLNTKQFRVEPTYESIAIYIHRQIGEMDIGQGYFNENGWFDTTFVEVPVDPNKTEPTRTDILINDQHKYDPEKLILAKLNGKWGLINSKGEVTLPFLYDSIKLFPHPYASEFGPLLLPCRNNAVVVLNQKMAYAIEPEILQKYFPYPAHTQIKALELTYFQDHLLIQQKGKYTFNKIVVKGHYEKGSFNGNIEKLYVEPYEYEDCGVFIGGEFNVLDLKTQKFLYPKWQRKIFTLFNSGKTQQEIVAMDIRSKKSIDKAYYEFCYGFNPKMKITFSTKKK